MATTDTMERGPLRLNQSQLLPLIPMLMLMPGTATMDMDTVAMDGEATTGLTATTVTTEKGPLRLTLKLMLMLGMTLRIRWLLRLRTQIRLLPPLRILGLLGLSLPIEKWTRLQIAIFRRH